MDYDTCSSLAAMFFDNTTEIGNRPFLWSKENGEWISVSGIEARSEASALSSGLKSLGLRSGDRVALASESRPEWLISDIAIMAAGGISVPLYTTNQYSDHLHVLKDSGAIGAIISGSTLAKNLLPAAVDAGLNFVITMEAIEHSGSVDIVRWEKLIADNMAATPNIDGLSRAQTACLIYTSGTGGAPKGVMLSHGSIISNCKGAYQLLLALGLDQEIFLSFLPLSHSYEHTAGLMFPLSIKAQIYYAEGADKLAANMVEVRPTIMTAVPRLYETMHSRILRGIQQKGGLSEKLFMKTVSIGRKKYQGHSTTLVEAVLDPLLTKLVRRKVAARFGGRLKAMVSGGAPLNFEIGTFFKALDVELLQGYGQTEAAPIISCNLPAKNKINSVGPPLVGVDVKIAEDGEILVKGELVMQGYWNLQEQTDSAVQDGWLHTGDIGQLDEDGFLIITDRKKDIIVNSGGDNISPQRIEGFLTMQPEISQAMVYGDQKPNLVALIVPDPEFTTNWVEENVDPGSVSQLTKDEGFRKKIVEAIDRVNDTLSVVERVRNFAIVMEEFTIDNTLMTPSLKIRRHKIIELYGAELEALYLR